MKKIKYFIPMLILFIIFDVKAIDSCTTEEMARLKELANNVKFKTDYEINTTETTNDAGEKIINDVDVSYKIQVINDNEDLKYFYKLSSQKEKIQVSSNDLSNIRFPDGEKLQISIFSYTTNLCTNELLKTETIDLPIYNVYYYLNQDKCKSNSDFKYCKEFMEVDLSIDEIDNLYNKYVSEKGFEKTSNFLKENIIYILIGVVVIIFGLIFGLKIFKKRKKKLDI